MQTSTRNPAHGRSRGDCLIGMQSPTDNSSNTIVNNLQLAAQLAESTLGIGLLVLTQFADLCKPNVAVLFETLGCQLQLLHADLQSNCCVGRRRC